MATKSLEAIADELEQQFVDRHNLSTVLDALIIVCENKAEHLLTNWQDRSAAKSWEHDAKQIGRIIGSIEN